MLKTDDTRHLGPIFGGHQDGNIFKMVSTYFRVQMDLFRVQIRHIWTNEPEEVEYIQKMEYIRSCSPIFVILQDGNIYEMVWTYVRVQMDLF